MVIYKRDFALCGVERAGLEFGELGRNFAGIRGESQGIAEESGERAGARVRLCR
jgi:hypothetical protein